MRTKKKYISVKIKRAAYPKRESRWVSMPDHWYGYTYLWGYLVTIKIRKWDISI